MSGIMLNFAGVSAASVPGAPTIGTATATGASTATVSFTAPASDGGSVILSYTATSSPAGGTGTLVQAGSGTINVTGLSGGTSYTFTVTATNAIGTSAPSAASNSITTTVVRYLFGWGNNENDGLGTAGGNSPRQVGSASNWQSISNMGRSWGAGIKTNGELWVWGYNQLGQLGLGNTTTISSPVQVGTLTNWALVAACNYSCIAVKTDGTLWTWGENTSGQLGNGNTTNRSSPVQVSGASNWATPGGTTATAFCVKTDGTLWSWGAAIGLGSGTAARSSPAQVGSDTDWARAKGSQTGGASVIAFKTGGQLWGWGAGFNGRLGRGNTTDYSSAVQVGAGSTWIDAEGIGGVGSYHSVLVKSTGELFTTGWNLAGQLGLGDTTSRSTLTQVGALTTWKFARGALNSSFAVTTGNKLFAWGNNSYGQLGTSNNTYFSSPVQVGSNDWIDVAAGTYNKTHGIKSTL